MWLQEAIGVLVFGMAGCAGQTRHLTPPSNICAPHLSDLEQQKTIVNVSECDVNKIMITLCVTEKVGM
jgi:hypothetical protein